MENFVDRMESILTQIGNSFYDTFHQVHSSIWKAGLIYFSIPCTVYILYCFIELKVCHGRPQTDVRCRSGVRTPVSYDRTNETIPNSG